MRLASLALFSQAALAHSALPPTSASASPAAAVSASALQSLQADLEAIVTNTSAKYNCSIAAAVLAPNAGVNVSAAAGKVSFLHGAPATTAGDQFVWGSITKISTGTAILRLVEEGKIKLDDTIPQYVDPMIAKMYADSNGTFPFNSSEAIWGPEVADVTIRHLATMRSGIPDFDTAKPWPPPPKDPLRATLYQNPTHDYTPPELFGVSWVATGKLLFKPGTKLFEYSSTNFMLLGLILAQQAGVESWRDFDQASFLPESVRESLPSFRYMKTGAPLDATRMHGYDRTTYNGATAQVPGTDVGNVHGVFAGWSASDLTCTVTDAANLAYYVYGPDSPLLQPSSQQVMLPTDPIYGFATFNLTGQNGFPYPYDIAYGHIGATYGYQSILSFHPSLNATIAIASNMENDDQTHPSDTLCQTFAAVKNSLTGSEAACYYKPKGYYGGECKCTF